MLANIREFRKATAGAMHLDWHVIGANFLGIFCVIFAGLHARAVEPVIEASAQAGMF